MGGKGTGGRSPIPPPPSRTTPALPEPRLADSGSGAVGGRAEKTAHESQPSLGERRRAAEGWLRFRRWPLAHTPDYYARLAENVQPSEEVLPPTPHSAVSGEVDAASAATLDREVLRLWAAMRSEEAMRRHWST